MIINNREGSGFRCRQCGEIYPTMWANICNGCRQADAKHTELVEEIKLLRKQLAENNTKYEAKDD